jgi:hypothetical protein
VTAIRKNDRSITLYHPASNAHALDAQPLGTLLNDMLLGKYRISQSVIKKINLIRSLPLHEGIEKLCIGCSEEKFMKSIVSAIVVLVGRIGSGCKMWNIVRGRVGVKDVGAIEDAWMSHTAHQLGGGGDRPFKNIANGDEGVEKEGAVEDAWMDQTLRQLNPKGLRPYKNIAEGNEGVEKEGAVEDAWMDQTLRQLNPIVRTRPYKNIANGDEGVEKEGAVEDAWMDQTLRQLNPQGRRRSMKVGITCMAIQRRKRAGYKEVFMFAYHVNGVGREYLYGFQSRAEAQAAIDFIMDKGLEAYLKQSGSRHQKRARRKKGGQPRARGRSHDSGSDGSDGSYDSSSDSSEGSYDSSSDGSSQQPPPLQQRRGRSSSRTRTNFPFCTFCSLRKDPNEPCSNNPNDSVAHSFQ